MKCLFVHDFRSYKDKENVYTTNLSYEILKERYVDVFGELNILNRAGTLTNNQNINNYVKASGVGINFIDKIGIFTPASFFMKYKKIRKITIENVAKSEYVIIRLDSFLGLIAARYCRKTSKKYLIEVVGCVWDSFWNRGIMGKLIAYPLFRIMQYEVKRAPYVVYVTSKFLQHRYPTLGNNTNISNVQLACLNDLYLQDRIKYIKNLDASHVFELVTVASIDVKYKGQETVLRAIYELKKRGYVNYRYHLIGDGEGTYLKSLCHKLKIEEQIIFHGSMKHDNVMDFLEKCDIYIQPSKQEGLPRALIEGMSKGLLCFGTCVAGIPELLDQQMIFSIKRNNYMELTELLIAINKNEWMRQVKRNFIEAKKYEKSILEARRKSFFESFIQQKDSF